MEVSPGSIPQEPQIGHGSYSFVVRMGSMAVKVSSCDERIPDDIINEVGILRMLNHPHVIKITRIIIDQQRHQVGLVLPEYQSDLHDQLGKLNPDQIQKILFRILTALAFLHENDIIHRDVSSKNILVNYGGEDTVLTDFGLARMKDYLQTGSLSFGYSVPNRPPEVVLQNGISCRSDIWAVGIVFAEMLLGRPIQVPSYLADEPLNAEGQPLEPPVPSARLNWIFSQVGTPAAKYMDRLDSELRDLEIYPQGEIFRNLPDSTSPAAIDLLKRMLYFSNASRIPAVEALKHPYFNGYSEKIPKGVFSEIRTKVHIGPPEDRAKIVDWLFSVLQTTTTNGEFMVRAETVFLAVLILDRYLSGFSKPAPTLEVASACLTIASSITEPVGLNLEYFKEIYSLSRSQIADLMEEILQQLMFGIIIPTTNCMLSDYFEDFDLTTLTKIQKILRILIILQPCKNIEEQFKTAVDLAKEPNNQTLEQAVSKWILKDWAGSLKMYYNAVAQSQVLPKSLEPKNDLKSPHKTPRHKPRIKLDSDEEISPPVSPPVSPKPILKTRKPRTPPGSPVQSPKVLKSPDPIKEPILEPAPEPVTEPVVAPVLVEEPKKVQFDETSEKSEKSETSEKPKLIVAPRTARRKSS